MKKISIEVSVDDDFEAGCCNKCPFSYQEEYEIGDYFFDWIDVCVMDWDYDECQLVVKESESNED